VENGSNREFASANYFKEFLKRKTGLGMTPDYNGTESRAV